MTDKRQAALEAIEYFKAQHPSINDPLIKSEHIVHLRALIAALSATQPEVVTVDEFNILRGKFTTDTISDMFPHGIRITHGGEGE